MLCNFQSAIAHRIYTHILSTLILTLSDLMLKVLI